MPRFRIQQSWRETVYYSNVIYIEADSEQEAKDMAYEDRCTDDCDAHDSEYDTDSFEIDDTDEVDDNNRIIKEPVAAKKSARSLPTWF